MTNFLKKLVQILKIFSGGPYRDRRPPKIRLNQGSQLTDAWKKDTKHKTKDFGVEKKDTFKILKLLQKFSISRNFISHYISLQAKS